MGEAVAPHPPGYATVRVPDIPAFLWSSYGFDGGSTRGVHEATSFALPSAVALKFQGPISKSLMVEPNRSIIMCE